MRWHGTIKHGHQRLSGCCCLFPALCAGAGRAIGGNAHKQYQPKEHEALFWIKGEKIAPTHLLNPFLTRDGLFFFFVLSEVQKITAMQPHQWGSSLKSCTFLLLSSKVFSVHRSMSYPTCILLVKQVPSATSWNLKPKKKTDEEIRDLTASLAAANGISSDTTVLSGLDGIFTLKEAQTTALKAFHGGKSCFRFTPDNVRILTNHQSLELLLPEANKSGLNVTCRRSNHLARFLVFFVLFF